MTTILRIAAAIAALAGAAPAVAQTGYYSTFVTRSTMWRCADATCTAPRGDDRDAVLCELVVQRVGALASFSAGGTAFGEDKLAKCNARAR